MGKFWTFSKKGYFRLFWISDLFEKCWPPISDQFQTFLNLRTYWWWKTPQTNILKGLLRHIYIEKGQIRRFNLSFLGWGLKVTYYSDIFEKLRPSPPWVFKIPKWKSGLFCFVCVCVCVWCPPSQELAERGTFSLVHKSFSSSICWGSQVL